MAAAIEIATKESLNTNIESTVDQYHLQKMAAELPASQFPG